MPSKSKKPAPNRSLAMTTIPRCVRQFRALLRFGGARLRTSRPAGTFTTPKSASCTNTPFRPFILVLAAWLLLPPAVTAAGVRVTESFDANWLFLKADARNAEQVGFDDSGWRKLDVPHDWSIEGPFAETNRTGGAGAFLPGGVG